MIPGYRIDRVLGKGGMGTVYRATQLSLSRPVAIKILAPRLAADPAYVERFLCESRSVGALQHENVIGGIDQGQAGCRYFFVMEFVDGETIADRLRRAKTIPEREAVRLARQTAEGLRYALRYGFLHRDVKPANLLIAPDGRVKICDLGISKSVEDERQGETILCSPSYASPESLQGKLVDHRSDIYSLGISLYEMLTGAPPFPGPDRNRVVRQQLEDPPPPPRRTHPALSEAVERLVLRMLAKDPALRPQTYEELIAELESSAMSRRTPSSTPTVTRRKSLHLFRREASPVWSLGIAALGLAGLVIGIVLLRRPAGKSQSDRPEPLAGPPRGGMGQPGKSEEEPSLDRFYRLIRRANLCALAAFYCDCRGRVEEARGFRATMEELEREILAGRHGRRLPDFLRTGDQLRSFRRMDLTGASPERVAQRLSEFLLGLREGERAEVVVLRNGDPLKFEVRFEERPAEFEEIARVVRLNR